jgi:hypothetical protein
MSDTAMITRAATRCDAKALAALTTLDNRHRPSEAALLAETNGTVVAAIAITSGAVLAAADRPDTEAIHALRRGRYRLMRQSGDVGPAWPVARRLGLPSAVSTRKDSG